jgi:hypothetical protein
MQGTIDQQTAVLSSSYDRPALLRRSAARKLLASTYWEYKPGFDRDLQDRSKSAATLSVQAGATAGEALPFRRLLASTPTYDKDLEDRSAFTTSGLLENTRKRLEVRALRLSELESASLDARLVHSALRLLCIMQPAVDADMRTATHCGLQCPQKAVHLRLLQYIASAGDCCLCDLAPVPQASAVTGAKADSTGPFRRLLGRDHTSDRDLEDRFAFAANPTLDAAVKRLEVRADIDLLVEYCRQPLYVMQRLHVAECYFDQANPPC